MIRKHALYLAWLLSCIAFLGSLYYSEIRHLEPCHLCWYQRICIYPLVVILGMATYKGFTSIIPYVIPQVVVGIMIAIYQVLIQEIPYWHPINMCGAGPSCTDKIDIGLGFITLPMIGAFTYAVIALLLFAVWHKDKEQNSIS